MKFLRTTFWAVLALTLLYAGYIAFLNYDLLKESLLITRRKAISVGAFILISFLVGFVLMGVRFLIEALRRDR